MLVLLFIFHGRGDMGLVGIVGLPGLIGPKVITLKLFMNIHAENTIQTSLKGFSGLS